MIRRPLLAFAAFASLAGPAAATVVDENSGLVVFGDSLSDVGRAAAAARAIYGVEYPPSPPYHEGRFSNGPIWADVVGARFEDAGKPVENYAFGGANALGTGLDDLAAQVRQYAAESTFGAVDLGDDPLASVWIGANDLFGGIRVALDQGLDEEDELRTAFDALSDGIGNAIRLTARGLRNTGIDDILLFNLPDLSTVPGYLGLDAAFFASDEYNMEIEEVAGELRGFGFGVTEIDVFSLFETVTGNPGAFGYANVTEPCVIVDFDRSEPSVDIEKNCTEISGADPDEYLFFDPVHPGARAHAVVAAQVIPDIAIIPLPATLPTLAAAIVLLAATARRRA